MSLLPIPRVRKIKTFNPFQTTVLSLYVLKSLVENLLSWGIKMEHWLEMIALLYLIAGG